VIRPPTFIFFLFHLPASELHHHLHHQTFLEEADQQETASELTQHQLEE
jgi:hypothetical protein